MNVESSEDVGPSVSLQCPHCLEPVKELDHFCPHCGGPITSHASTHPLGQVFSAGRGYLNATTGRPRLIVVIGMWMIFGPAVLMFAAMVSSGLYFFLNSQPSYSDPYSISNDVATLTGILAMMLLAAAMTLYATILVKVTRRYLQAKTEEKAQAMAEDNDADDSGEWNTPESDEDEKPSP